MGDIYSTKSENSAWKALPKPGKVPTRSTYQPMRTGKRMGLGNIKNRETNMSIPYNPGYLATMGAGGIKPDFPQGDVGSPFWFSNIGGNHFPREGFTYTPFDTPVVPFKDQLQGYIDDEDAQMAINFLAANATGAEHYFKGKTESLIAHLKDFTKLIELDNIANAVAKECLAFGNSFWRLRKPIWEVDSFKDFQQIPIDSAARIWWTPDRRPIWYEFRGSSYNGYFRPYEIMHFKWNPVNASVFGFGMMTQIVKTVSYEEQTPDGLQSMVRMSYLDIKHGVQNLVYRSLYRYLPRNVYEAPNSTEEERGDIRSEIRSLFPGEDLVHGSQGMKIQELGSGIRAYEPNAFMDLFQGAIFKALQTSKGRIAGQSQGPTYANGEESAILDEIGLAQFPIQLKNQISEMILEPWYYFNEKTDPRIALGIIPIPWTKTDLELRFGKSQKTQLEPDKMMAWLQFLQQTGNATTVEIRKAAEEAGVPLISDEEGNIPAMNNPGANIFPGVAPGTPQSAQGPAPPLVPQGVPTPAGPPPEQTENRYKNLKR